MISTANEERAPSQVACVIRGKLRFGLVVDRIEETIRFDRLNYRRLKVPYPM